MSTNNQLPEKDKKPTISEVHTDGGDFVGQDKVGSDKVGGDKVGGNKIEANTYIEHATYLTPSVKDTDKSQTTSPPKVSDGGFRLSGKLFGILIGISTIIACIAAVIVVPEVRQFLVAIQVKQYRTPR
jgi:hypothetical protein